VRNQKGIKNRSFFFLISFLFLTSLLSIKTLKKVHIQDIRISGSELFSQNDVVKNSSLNFPIRLIFIETNLLEKELKQNLSLKYVSVNRELFPFGLKVYITSRIPIAYGERILNDEKILGFIDKDGIFINKQHVDEKNFDKPTIQVFGWKEKFKKILSKIFIAIENYELNKIYKAKVVKIMDFGAFCELEPGLTTLHHSSELSWTKKNISAKKMFKVGDEIDCVITEIDKEKRRVAISHRLTKENPFETFEKKYPVDTIVEGEIVNKNEYSYWIW